MIKRTEINNGIVLCEYTDGLLFGTDALLLSDFIKAAPLKSGIDIGVGSGAVSLLLLSKNKAAHITGIEIQSKYAELAVLNAQSNGLGSRFSCVCGDAKNYKKLLKSETADFVVSNPPFMKANSGKLNQNEAKRIARHEEFLPADDLCKAAFYWLKFGGSFYLVYRPERLCTIITALRDNKLEPKRIEFIHSADSNSPSLVLIEAKKGGAEGAAISFMNI